MVGKNDFTCWEITNCQRSEGCPARKQPETPCWEVAAKTADYRSAFRVCKDCIVYLMKKENSSLSEEEIQTILVSKGVCVLAGQCPQHIAGANS